MKQRNNLVELARFLFALLVVGYHVQMSMTTEGTNLFENGALAVEFFFLISGYFLARSIEKLSAKGSKVPRDSLRFMWGKVKGILPAHLVAVVAVIVVILACDLAHAGTIVVNGLPSVFLVQMVMVWNDSFNQALIVPEWYLSSMLVCMLLMVPLALLLRKKVKGVFVPTILVGILAVVVVAVGFGVKWALPQNFVYDVRAWGEMAVGMFAYYLSASLARKEWGKGGSIALKVIEGLGYGIPVVLGIVPMPAFLMPVCMAVTVVCVFAAVSVTFAGKGIQIKSAKLNGLFGYLGGLSLAIYLFHPVVITLLGYVYPDCALWSKHLVVYSAAIACAILFGLVQKGCRILIERRKQNKPSEA